jgi:aldehyde dehydrogenase (NAD+)
MGNRVILAASEPFPLAATDFYQVLETSDVPAGVVNIVTGSHAELAPTLAKHLDVDAVWSFSSTDLSAQIEKASAGNLKRTWVNNGHALTPTAKEYLAAATEVKNIWIPYGE